MIRSKKDYYEKINLLNELNKSYYDLDSPILSDFEYDKIKKQLIDYENKHLDLNIVKNKIGFEPSKKFSKVKHTEKMLSLENAFNLEDINIFIKK